MSGTRGGIGRIVAMGIGLAVALLLLAAGEAKAAKYEVAQCGWGVGFDADWADNTGGVKFHPGSYCVPPAGTDPFDGVHMKTFTSGGAATVGGTRFGRWRWTAPPGTGIVKFRGTWWHNLHDGLEQRIGAVDGGGGFSAFATASTTNTNLTDFAAGFGSPMPAVEDRLLCARGDGKWCSLDPASWSAVRGVIITVEDDAGPAAGIGGELTAGGWRRGGQGIQVWGSDSGGGIRYGETTLDGNRVALTEYRCAKAMIGGEWYGTRMRPCETGVSAAQSVSTTTFSDGPHALAHCVTDFAGNVGCTSPQTVLIDNNAPAHVRDLTLAGGEGWRRSNDFDLSWVNPDQGPASPVGGALWRVTGPAGYDTGVQFAAGRGLAALNDLHVPGPGAYSLQVWLRDEAGNDAPATATAMPLRFDDVAPGVAFEATAETGVPEPAPGRRLRRPLRAGGRDDLLPADRRRRIGPSCRPNSSPAPRPTRRRWSPTSRSATSTPASTSSAPTPSTGRATSPRPRAAPTAPRWRLAVRRRGGGGTAAARDRRPPRGATTRIVAKLRRGRRLRSDLTVPFGAGATLTGRLTRGDGAGLAGRDLRIVQRPSSGAISRPNVIAVRTGPAGGFHLHLRPGPSRRVVVAFPGEGGLDGATRAPLGLRVRGGVVLRAAPRALRTGRALRLSGRVRARGAPVPRRGKLVAIQYFESRTRHWRPVLVTHTDFLGRFHTRYRFRYVTGSARVRLRAIALAEERWPYAPGASRPVTVRVTG